MRSLDIYTRYGIDSCVTGLIAEAEEELTERFHEIDEICAYNQLKVISAMQEERVSSECMGLTTGYGYSDIGRDTLERVYARIFGTEAAIVRGQIISGTHALTLSLTGLLRGGDSFISAAGLPYDTLLSVIEGEPGSLHDQGIGFDFVSLLPDGTFDLGAIRDKLTPDVKLILVQRSRGYALRKSLTVSGIGELADFVKKIRGDIIILVDNCYGEYTDTMEPSEMGADICVGSLIKNPGGGIAPVGGYIAGRSDLIELIAARLTAPGLGREAGPSLGLNRLLYQGTYLAPMVTGEAMKGAALAERVYRRLGFDTSCDRGDIVTAIVLGSPEPLLLFCRAIQAAAAVDSFVTPEPSPMPGYESKIVMASGSFIQGSSIELSCDAPMREPYAVYFQGGLSYYHARLGIALSLEYLIREEFIKI